MIILQIVVASMLAWLSVHHCNRMDRNTNHAARLGWVIIGAGAAWWGLSILAATPSTAYPLLVVSFGLILVDIFHDHA